MHLVLPQKLTHPLQICGEGAVHAGKNLQLGSVSNADAHIDRLFVHIHGGAAGIYYVHIDLLCRERKDAWKNR
jgi:hypothetical protein